MRDRRTAALLGLVLVTAAALRFTGLGWGLRHPPHEDERVFVESTQAMLRAFDFDHRFYEYPGLFFYLLGLVLAFVPGGMAEGPRPYLLARGLVAAFGVLAVYLVYRLARRFVDRGHAVFAAALLAVSPVAVETAHMVRTDVVLQAFVLLALLAFRPGATGAWTARADLLAGVALGLAGAVKFSAVFLLPVFLARRLQPSAEERPTHGGPLTGILRAGLAAIATFVVASPYALLHIGEFARGVETQVTYHYVDRGAQSYGAMLLRCARIVAETLGWPALALGVWGLWHVRKAWRSWFPFLILPVCAVLVMASAEVVYVRLLLPFVVVLFVLAAVGLGVLRQQPPLAIALAVIALGVPLFGSGRYVAAVRAPSTRDLVTDWANGLDAGTRLLTSVEGIALDRRLLEVMEVPRLRERAQVLEADLVAATDRDPQDLLSGLEPVQRFSPATRFRGPEVTVYRVPAALRARLREIGREGAEVQGTENEGESAGAWDGRLDTAWATSRAQVPGDALVVKLPHLVRLARVEARLGEEWKLAARDFDLEVLEDGGAWRNAPWAPGRPDLDGQHPARDGYSQVLLIRDPRPVRGVRLIQTRNAARRWRVAELRLSELVAENGW